MKNEMSRPTDKKKKKIQWPVVDKLATKETPVTHQPFKDTTATE
jgi:hypothetical protein